MSTNKTENLQLHSWTLGDPVKMSEFNENFAALDDICGGIPKIQFGSYQGNGKYGYQNKNTLTFDFEPKAVMISGSSGASIWFRGQTTGGTYYENQQCGLSWSGNTLSWSNSTGASYQYNSGTTYYYVAIG